MPLKTFIIISSIASSAMFAGLFVLKAIMPGVALHWADQGTELNAAQRILFAVAVFWSRFWWWAWPFVAGAVCALVGVIALFRRAPLDKNGDKKVTS